MSVVVTSLAAILLAVLVNLFVVPQVLRATAGAAVLLNGEGPSEKGLFAAFIPMFAILLAWAYVCFLGADWIAGEDFGQRWVLLIAAAGLAGGPYLLYQRNVDRHGIAAMLVPPFHSALQFAGGLQSKIVLVGMLSGIYFDWWEHLPG